MEFEETLINFATSEEGLGRARGRFARKRTAQQYSAFFYKANGQQVNDPTDIESELKKGSTLFAYSNGALMPSPVSLDKDGNLKKSGEDYSKLDKPPKPGFLDKILSVFSKKRREKVNTYNEYQKKAAIGKIFEAKKKNRTANRTAEIDEKKIEAAEATHDKQLEQIQAKRNTLQKDNPTEYLSKRNTWHGMSFDRLCIELARQYHLAAPNIGPQAEDLRIETINSDNPKYMEYQKLGYRIFATVIDKGQDDIAESIIANIVNKEPTDKQRRDFNDFLSMSYIDNDYRSEDPFKDYDFTRTASVNSPYEISATNIISGASAMMNRRKSFDDTAAYMALAAYKTYVVGDNFGSKYNDNISNVNSQSGIIEMGHILYGTQQIVGNIDFNDKEISLANHELITINKTQLLIGSFAHKQDNPNKEENSKCGFENLMELNVSYPVEHGLKNLDVKKLVDTEARNDRNIKSDDYTISLDKFSKNLTSPDVIDERSVKMSSSIVKYLITRQINVTKLGFISNATTKKAAEDYTASKAPKIKDAKVKTIETPSLETRTVAAPGI